MRRPGKPSDGWREDDRAGVIRAEFDWSETPPAIAVVETLAVATDTEILDVEPLLEQLDPDALNALVGDENRADAGTVVVFAMADHEVSVHSDGQLVVEPLDTVR